MTPQILLALFQAIAELTKVYEGAKADAKANGLLTDADENLLHEQEDAAMASHPWQRD